MVVPQRNAQDGLAYGASSEAKNLDLIDPGYDFLQASYPTPESTRRSFQTNPHQSHAQSFQEFQLPEYGIFNATCDPPMSFRDRHRFLDGIFDLYPNPDLITAKDMGDVARKVGLLMDEVLSWFEDEKSRRAKLLANNQHVAQDSACQYPPSPESITTRGSDKSAPSSFDSASLGNSSPSLDAFLPGIASTSHETPAPSKPKRGRPAGGEIKTEAKSSSPDAKRKKVPVKYPCPDCGDLQPAERWTEHFDRSHFPENVWECPKINQRTGKPCSSSLDYRPSYRCDNFANHLKKKHGCIDKSEIAELKRACRLEVTDFFHKFCGFPFCEQGFGSRAESLKHIKEHFREISERPNPPADLGVSQWKHRCDSEHKLQLGVHYRRSKGSNSDLKDEDHDQDQDYDEDGGSNQGDSHNQDHNNWNSQSDNSNEGEDGGSGDKHRKNGGSGDDFIFDTEEFQRQLQSQEPLSKGLNSECPVEECSKIFVQSCSHEANMEIPDMSPKLQFPCIFKDCDKRFKMKTDSQRHHQSVHMKQWNHRCDSCKTLFAQKEFLEKHIDDGCSESSDSQETSLVSTADHMGDEELDFPLYPGPSQDMFSQQLVPFKPCRNFDMDSTMCAEVPRLSSALEPPRITSGSSSNHSTASDPSAIGSTHSIQGKIASASEWPTHGLGLDSNPRIVGYGNFVGGNEYKLVTSGMEEFAVSAKSHGFVDPSILHVQYSTRQFSTTQYDDTNKSPAYPKSLELSRISRRERQVNQGVQSSYISSQYNSCPYPYPPPRRPPVLGFSSQEYFSSEECREKDCCTYPDCGKIFRDLKAHRLTHMEERPEKCPIQTCDYHIKGFSRKYDRKRHALTHYKGTMVCCFCPRSGSTAEKSFNRADVFKRHLTSVHRVEQTPPNSRKKTSGNIISGKKLSGYAPDATGKCSTCAMTFSNAQDFYEHLDDCVLRIVQQEEPSEGVHALRLVEVESEQSIHKSSQ